MVAFHHGLAWSTPTPFDLKVGGSSDYVGLALSPQGVGIGVFDDGNTGGAGICSDGRVGTPHQLIAGGRTPKAAVDSLGNALVVYTVTPLTAPTKVMAAWCH